MKKLLLGLCLLSTVALANTVRVTLPYDTVEVVSCDYIVDIDYLKILVKNKDGNYVMYVKQTEYRRTKGKRKIFQPIPDRFIYTIDKSGTIKDRIEVSW